MGVGCEESHLRVMLYLDRETRASPNLPHFCMYTTHQGGLVLWYSPGSLTRRKIWDTAGYKRVSHAFDGMCIGKRG